MQGPEGRPPNVSPARKGWEIDPEEDPSAGGAALNRSSALCVIRSEADLSRRAVEGSAVPQTLPGNTESRLATNLSSRPERSVVERSAVVFDLTGFGQGFLRAKRKAAGDGNKLVAGSYTLFTDALLEDAADGGHE